MKRLFTLLLVFVYSQLCFGQTNVDKEKLLNYYQSQQYAEATTYLESIYPSDTKDIKALSQMAYCFLMAGKFTEAEKKYISIDEIQPNSIQVEYAKSRIAALKK